MNASPIRNAEGKLAITPGVWALVIEAHQWLVGMPLDYGMVACARYDRTEGVCEQDKANAALIAEAGTITNQTGRTPAELAALVRELREALSLMYETAVSERTQAACSTWDLCESALAKSEGV
jgi:hypothetical protein